MGVCPSIERIAEKWVVCGLYMEWRSNAIGKTWFWENINVLFKLITEIHVYLNCGVKQFQ